MRILELAMFMQRKTWLLDEWFSYMKLDTKTMNTSSPHCPFTSERYTRRTKLSLSGDQKSIRLTFIMLYLLDLWYSHLFRLTLNKVSRRDPHDVIAEIHSISVCLLSKGFLTDLFHSFGNNFTDIWIDLKNRHTDLYIRYIYKISKPMTMKLHLTFSDSVFPHNISGQKVVDCQSATVNKTCKPSCMIRRRNFLSFPVFL